MLFPAVHSLAVENLTNTVGSADYLFLRLFRMVEQFRSSVPHSNTDLESNHSTFTQFHGLDVLHRYVSNTAVKKYKPGYRRVGEVPQSNNPVSIVPRTTSLGQGFGGDTRTREAGQGTARSFAGRVDNSRSGWPPPAASCRRTRLSGHGGHRACKKCFGAKVYSRP